jgi:hemerythrin
MQDQSGMTWTDDYLLGFDPMDDTHQEFVDLVDALLTCADEDMPRHLDAFIAHAESHFGQEKAWMEETGFPATECHVDEHAAVYQSALDVKPLVAAGNMEVCRQFAQALADWFPGHADYLDSALAHWMVKRIHGGAPVVLRRTMAPRDV